MLELGEGISAVAWHICWWPGLQPLGGGVDRVPKNWAGGLP
jgi:hypothetical protein